MGIDEKERERAILDVTVELLLRHGYNKVTMSDVADAVGLNRRLVYLLFPSKDALIKALLLRELNIYAEVWNRYLDSDPLGGTVASVYPTREYLQAMQEIGVVRQDINTRAMAFILDALTPSILAALSSHTKAPLDDSNRSSQPSFDELVETVAELCECLLTPKAGANLEAGKAIMRRKIEEAQAQFTKRSNQ